MGNAQAVNQVDASVNAAIGIANSTTQNCSVQIGNGQQINVIGCDQTVVSNVDFSNYVQVNTNCTQTAVVNNNIQQQVQQELNQMAQAVTELGGIGDSIANNIATATVTATESIVNTFTQNCVPSISNSQEINIVCPNTPGTSAIVNNISSNNLSNSLTQCVQNSSAVNSAVQDIKQKVTQKATATVEGIAGPLIFLIIIVILIFFMTQGKNIAIIIALIVVVIIIYLGTAYLLKWVPFNQPNQPNS